MGQLDRCYNIADLRDVARRRLPKGVFEYIDKGTGATSLWIMETPNLAALKVTAKDFKINRPKKDWEDD